MLSPVTEILGPVLTEGIWPVIYTLVGVFVGLYFDELVDTERKRTQTIFRPLLNETSQIKRANWDTPLPEIRTESGDLESVLQDVERLEILQLNTALTEAILKYLEAITNLARVHQPHVPVAKVLDGVGYGDHVVARLPPGMVASGNEGVDPTDRPAFPGPELIVGSYTTGSGRSDYFDDGYRASVQTHRRYPLFAFLLEHFEAIRTATSPDAYREICEQSPEIDVQYMDTNFEGWEEGLWDALHSPFEPPESAYEQLDFSIDTASNGESSMLVAGETFADVLRGSEMATRFITFQARQDVIDAATEINAQLVSRLGKRLIDPRRWYIAATSS
jgi:hypothetical protein